MKKKKILFVCTFNKMRSKTAEVIYKNDKRFEVKSAGVDEYAEVSLDMELLEWADYVLVMEKSHRKWILKHFPDLSDERKVLCLGIPDLYEFMDTALIPLLKDRVEGLFGELE
jgi:predicted protein tyrosine phosphatase